jgi:hypothetical protein
VEIVHVKLPNERTEVIMFEIFREDLVAEFIDLFHNEPIVFLIPGYNIIKRWIINDVKSFDQERWNICICIRGTWFLKLWLVLLEALTLLALIFIIYSYLHLIIILGVK